jgi:hypothetical protein
MGERQKLRVTLGHWDKASECGRALAQPLMHPSETSPINFISSQIASSILNTRICVLDALTERKLKEPHTPRVPPGPARIEPPCPAAMPI